MKTTPELLDALHFEAATDGTGPELGAMSPCTGERIATLRTHTAQEVERKIESARLAQLHWRQVPAPLRGELVRRFGDALRHHKQALGELVTLETGKIISEGLGEVQEMIDICDYAVGLSRQLFGLTISSERPGHRMMETWHPMGVVGVISAFNFPTAVWAWNAALALVCGNTVVWKPSEKAPLTALACTALLARVAKEFFAAHPNLLPPDARDTPDALNQVLIGAREAGEALVASPHVPVVSATGSTRMGRTVAQAVAQRFGRCILELGGNNAMILAPSADLELAVRAITFSAVGTAGQRCTSLRRLIVHRSHSAAVWSRLTRAYETVLVGDPFAAGTLMGPLIDQASFDAMQATLERARADGGSVVGGARIEVAAGRGGCYVRPALVRMPGQTAVVREETFAPILYVLEYDTLDEAIAMQNDVPQGLSSSIFTANLQEAERFMSTDGSDCGIANVNIGTSGAEIGGAFGGEKETGGGRESGSDAWKGYMRRATNTINYSGRLPLAQGVRFDI
jgi:aldehyde dehydrogenase (NAD+)